MSGAGDLMLSKGPCPGVHSFIRSGAHDLIQGGSMSWSSVLHQDCSGSGARDLNLKKGTYM